MASELVWIAYPLAAALVVFYGIVALCLTFYRQNKQGHRDTTGLLLQLLLCSSSQCEADLSCCDADFFLTARNSVSAFRISWAFYASSMGSWALFSVAQYVSYAGECAQDLPA